VVNHIASDESLKYTGILKTLFIFEAALTTLKTFN
jgi:hypothetical protein